MGLWCTNYAIGGLVASPFAGLMAGAYCFDNWRFAFFMPALALFIVAVLFFFLQKNRPEDVGLPPIDEYKENKEKAKTKSIRSGKKDEDNWKYVLMVLKSKTVWALAMVYFFLKPTRYAILFWGPKYINETFGSGVTESSFISALFELGGPIGALLAGYVSDTVFKSKRMPVIILPLIALAIVLFFFNHLAVGGARSLWVSCCLL